MLHGSNTTYENQIEIAQEKQQRQLYRSIKHVEKSVFVNNTGELEIKKTKKLQKNKNIDQQHLSQFVEHMSLINQGVEEGSIIVEDIHHIYMIDTSSDIDTETQLNEQRNNYIPYNAYFEDIYDYNL